MHHQSIRLSILRFEWFGHQVHTQCTFNPILWNLPQINLPVTSRVTGIYDLQAVSSRLLDRSPFLTSYINIESPCPAWNVESAIHIYVDIFATSGVSMHLCPMQQVFAPQAHSVSSDGYSLASSASQIAWSSIFDKFHLKSKQHSQLHACKKFVCIQLFCEVLWPWEQMTFCTWSPSDAEKNSRLLGAVRNEIKAATQAITKAEIYLFARTMRISPSLSGKCLQVWIIWVLLILKDKRRVICEADIC